MSDENLPVSALATLDEDSAVPRYRQISDQLAQLILDVRPGARLPSEHELVAHLRVSRATATQALRDLEQRGLVYRRQGRGTFVADNDRAVRSDRLGQLPSFSEDLRQAGKTTSERVVAFDRIPAPHEALRALLLQPGAEVWRVERVIVSDDEPVVHVTSWLPCALYPALTAALIEATSLYEHLESTPGRGRPCSADEQWSASSVPSHTAKLLELPRASPVMKVERTAFLHDQTPAEYVVSYVRGETFVVSVHIRAHDHGRMLEPVVLSAP